MPDETVGQYVNPLDLQGSMEPGLISAQQAGGLGYGRYNVRTHYVRRSGLYQLPAAGPAGTGAAIVRLHAPCATKVITWVVEAMRQLGEKPTLPHWDTSDTNEALIWSEMRIDAPILQADGQTFFWRVAGEYHYASVQSAQATFQAAATAASIIPPEAFGLVESDFSMVFLRHISGNSPGSFSDMTLDKSLS